MEFPASSSSPRAAVARLWWIFFGPAVLLLLLRDVALRAGWFTASDIAFLVILLLMVLARQYEFKRGNAVDSRGDPVTESDIRQYAIRTLAIGFVLWLAANLIGNLWLPKDATL